MWLDDGQAGLRHVLAGEGGQVGGLLVGGAPVGQRGGHSAGARIGSARPMSP